MYTNRMRRNLMDEALTRLAEKGIVLFGIEDLVRELNLGPPVARTLAHRLQRANKTFRIKRGLYAVVPPEDWARPGALPVDWYLTAAAAVHPAPYFLTYYTGMEVHKMTQNPLRTVFLAVTQQRREINLGQVRFRFVTVKPDHFFGFEDLRVQETKTVRVADLEKTFIDCVDRFDLCGGVEEVFRGFARRHEDLDPDRLLRYLNRLNRPTLIKRLGFLLETLGHRDRELLIDLQRTAGRIKHYLPLDTTAPPEGNRDRDWELVVNTDIRRLLRATST